MRVVVLCGGSGSRLWPASRSDRPKPLLALDGATSLLRATLDRFAALGPALIVCGEAHEPAVMAEVPGVPRLVERSPSGTGPAIRRALAALPPDELALITPADHHVAHPEALGAAIRAAAPAAAAGRLVTFGVAPSGPATGYGWIRPGPAIDGDVRSIERFVEKPDADTARELFASGHLWNAGLFLVRAGAALAELDRLAPGSPPGAFDRQVMERTTLGAVIAVDCGWSDLGTWTSALGRGSPRRAGSGGGSPRRAGSGGGSPRRPGSAGGTGRAVLDDAEGAVTWSDGPAIAVLGVPGVTVVASAGGVLVAAPDRLEDIGAVAPPLPAGLDHGPGWSVERRALGPGDGLHVGEHDHAVVVAGEGRGRTLSAGRFVAGAPCVLVIVRLTSLPSGPEGASAAG